MSELDDAIRHALSAEDAKILEGFGADQAIHRQLLETLQGKFRVFNMVGWFVGFALFAVFCLCAWRFLTTAEVRDMLMWGGGAALACAGLGLVKLWFWLEIQKNAVVREVKRLELQVARLSARTQG